MTLYLSRNLKAHFSPRNSSLHSMSALCSAQVSRTLHWISGDEGILYWATGSSQEQRENGARELSEWAPCKGSPPILDDDVVPMTVALTRL